MKLVRVVLCSAVLTLPLAALARAPYTPPGSADAVLRLSWRMNIKAREDCRPRTQQELDALPVHMRTPEVCTADLATYALITRLDDGAADTLPILRGGVRGDRPLFVLEERTLTSGQHRVRIALHRMPEATHAEILLALDTVLNVEAGAVQLVTLEADARLRARSSAAAR